MPLDSLRNAFATLEQSLNYLNSDMARDPGLRRQFRSAAVQAFEYTHELAFKMLKRQLEQMAADESAIDMMPYIDIIRFGAEAGLVRDVARFRNYRRKRNIISHTFEERISEIIFILDDFLKDVRHLLTELEVRQRQTTQCTISSSGRTITS